MYGVITLLEINRAQRKVTRRRIRYDDTTRESFAQKVEFARSKKNQVVVSTYHYRLTGKTLNAN